MISQLVRALRGLTEEIHSCSLQVEARRWQHSSPESTNRAEYLRWMLGDLELQPAPMMIPVHTGIFDGFCSEVGKQSGSVLLRLRVR